MASNVASPPSSNSASEQVARARDWQWQQLIVADSILWIVVSRSATRRDNPADASHAEWS
jgi:hypothetical protein